MVTTEMAAIRRMALSRFQALRQSQSTLLMAPNQMNYMARMFASKRMFTEDHEWVETEEDGSARVGITDYAQEALGDVVYVELPAVGTVLAQKEQLGAVESVKAASDIYAPVSGEILQVNSELSSKPGLVNREPYEGGYLCTMKLNKPEEVKGLMTEDAYKAFTDKED